MTGGSLASSQYGIPRSTQDVDLVADLQLQHVAQLVQSLQDEFYLDAGQVREAIRNSSSFNLIHLESVYKVDVFIASVDPWGREQMKRRRPAELVAGETLYFTSPEDVILHKLGRINKAAVSRSGSGVTSSGFYPFKSPDLTSLTSVTGQPG
jgi:hypothetical protein